MKIYFGLGTNLADRLASMEKGFQQILSYTDIKSFRVSPVFESRALLPDDAPKDWDRPYLNLVCEAESSLSPMALLEVFKKIELEIGRDPQAPRWSPRVLDIDLLLYGAEVLSSENLTVPHPQISERRFVAGPLKWLNPDLNIPNQSKTVAEIDSSLPQCMPAWMGVLNVTPDSFSDGAVHETGLAIERTVLEWIKAGVQFLDLGAESTRPGAKLLTADEEWLRLRPALEVIQSLKKSRSIFPWISVDTRHPQTATRATEFGIQIINDVSGFPSGEMRSLMKGTKTWGVAMHNLGVPPSRDVLLPSKISPVTEISKWAVDLKETFQTEGISTSRLLIDPGIGFGKSAEQSWTLIQAAGELRKRVGSVVFGHSRKSFLQTLTQGAAQDRDSETLGVSIKLAASGVDVIRVHNVIENIRAWRAFVQSSAGDIRWD